MFDVEFFLKDQPGSLATLGEAMGAANQSFEGGGVFAGPDGAIAHYLFADGSEAAAVARKAGLKVGSVRKALIRQLQQDTPGQLGAIARALADASVNIIAQYSDHRNQLILVVEDYEKAETATRRWVQMST